MTEQHQTGFLERFDSVQHRMRVLRVTLVLGLAVASIAAIVALLASVDFYFELEAGTRSLLFALVSGGVGLAAMAGIARVLMRWGRPATASSIEERFPELGQSVRTTVQYGVDPEFDASEAGVAPTLVEALETTTLHRAAPLPLDTVVPKRRSYAAVLAAVGTVAALAASTAVNWEWSTAVRRALLADLPYTTVTVAPGNVEVEEGRDVTLKVDLEGRTDRTVVLQTRPAASGEPWSEYELSAETMVETGARQSQYQSRLAKVTSPLEYRFVAGPVTSESYRVDVRYPIAIESIEAEIEPPAYTGLPVKTVPDGNITALEGSRVRVRVQLDRPPIVAEAVLKRIGVRDGDGPRERQVPLTIEDRTIVLELDSIDDLQWSLVAESQDGSRLPDNSYRMRVRYDQAPRVSFADPDEELEVHTLAEVLMRIQARDDYGLSRSGIMFQINNGEEYALLQENFSAAAEAAEELERGEAAPRTLGVLQELLPLESFLLTQKDCIVYYAFAEDNYPSGPHHSESDLRFIDIRPFRQTFRLREPGEDDRGGDGGLTSLDELIRRERYALNRTLRLDRRAEEFGPKDLVTMDRLVEYQTEIADLTRELAEGLIANGADDVEVLFQAEAAMFSAVNALQVAELDTAFIQQKDAQQFLVEARNRLEILLAQAQNNRTLRQALGLLNSRLSQKLRRMNDDADRESAEALVERLQRLARTEEEISEELYAAAARMGMPGSGGSANPDAEQTSEDGEGSTGGDPEAATPEETESEQSPSDDGTEPEDSDDSASPSLNELETAQYDVVTEARDVQQLLNRMEGVTDLARDRMQAAAETADEAAGMLAAGDTDGSAGETGAAAEMFAELARHAAALLAAEASEQVSLSRDMAAQIAGGQRSLADELQQEDPPTGSGGGNAEIDSEDSVRQSQRAAERARTFEDVLQAIAGSTNLEDGEAADRVSEIMAEQQVAETVERIEQVPSALEQETTPETLTELADLADRMELTADQLDRLYRSIVMPRIELLRELEEEAVSLERQSPQLADQHGVQGWEQELDELLEEVEQAGAGTAAGEELQQVLAGLSQSEDTRWERGQDGRYTLPVAYSSNLRSVIEDLQQQIQELILLDLLADRVEAAPPEYEPLIEQYLKVLAATAADEDQ
jgi:hypothetical protein